MVICGTCGHSNADRLTFCEECGQRLGPRVAPPTPAIGAAPAPVATPPPAPSPAFRPPAPEISFGQRAPSAGAIAKPPATLADDGVRCPTCGNLNQRGLRFCVSCGQALTAPAPPVAAPPAPTPPEPRAGLHQTHVMADAPPLPAPAPTPAIAPARVVRVVEPEPPKAAPKICPRCRGVCDAVAQYCRYCGASLASEPVAPTSLPSPVSSGPPTDPTPAPVASSADPALSSAPATPAIDDAQYRPYRALSAARAPTPVATPVATQAVAPPNRGRIVLIAKDGGEGAQFPLGDTTDIGRLEGDVLLPDDRYIAPRHARLSWRAGVLYLRDLGTVNGLYVRLAENGGAQIARAGAAAGEIAAPLRDQDLFLVGQQVLRFEVVNDAAEGFGAASQHGTLLFGTPASPRYARLCQRTVEGVTRDVFYLRKVETVLGRESGDIVFTEDAFLSRRHAAIRVDAASKAFSLVDLGSSNGTFLQIREEIPLGAGAQFRIGQQLFRVELPANPAAPPPARS